MGGFKNWVMTPLLPPPPPPPDRSTSPQGLPTSSIERNILGAADKAAIGAYNWGIRPVSSPMGMATIPLVAATPVRYGMALGAGMMGHSAIQEAKQGNWFPSTESPGAILTGAMGALSGVGLGSSAAAAWLPKQNSMLSKARIQLPDQVNTGRREFLKKAGPVAAGTVMGLPAAAKLAGNLTKSAAPAAAETLVGARVYTYPKGMWRGGGGTNSWTGVQELWQTPTGYKTVTRHFDEALPEGAAQGKHPALPEPLYREKFGDPQVVSDGLGVGPTEYKFGKGIEELDMDVDHYIGTPLAGQKTVRHPSGPEWREWENVYEVANFQHPQFGKLVDYEAYPAAEVLYSDKAAYGNKILLKANFAGPNGLVHKTTVKPVTQAEAAQLVGPKIADHIFTKSRLDSTSASPVSGGLWKTNATGGSRRFQNPVADQLWSPSKISPKNAKRYYKATQSMTEGGW